VLYFLLNIYILFPPPESVCLWHHFLGATAHTPITVHTVCMSVLLTGAVGTQRIISHLGTSVILEALIWEQRGQR
jgi:hypothetical protein